MISQTVHNFNPRSDERSDNFLRNIKIYLWHFNPRSDERSDLLTFQYQTTMIMLFQSTLRRTERLVQQGLNILRSDFNPRSDERSDDISKHIKTDQYRHISIHAPTNGATQPVSQSMTFRRFQSTLRRTERPGTSALSQSDLYFNPRSDERSDSNFAQKNEKNYTKPLNNIIVFY